MNKLSFFYKTCEAWDAMFTDCASAEHSIEFEQYILMDDLAGRRFLELFIEKAQAGVLVRLLLDPVGSLGLESSEIFKRLIESGVRVKFYNPLKWINIFLPDTWHPRNHTKTLVIDERVGYVGSVCLHEEMRDWNDLHVRFEGELVQDVQRALHSKENRNWLDAKSRRHLIFRYELSRPHRNRNPLYEELLQEIYAAKDEIVLTSPYFLAPWRLRHALYTAINRGVKVKIMISESTDVRIADFVTRTYFRNLLRHGIRIYLFKEGMMHAKYAAVDTTWATIGSMNMDYLSLLHNREGNILIKDVKTVKIIQDHFSDDLNKCTEVTADYCRNIPWHHLAVGWLIRPLKRMI